MAFGLLWMPMDEGGQHPPTSVPHGAAPHVCLGILGKGTEPLAQGWGWPKPWELAAKPTAPGGARLAACLGCEWGDPRCPHSLPGRSAHITPAEFVLLL